MNLKGLKLAKEDADAFHVTGKDGKTFRVAKKGLSATMHGRIAQHFAEGGEVRHYDAGTVSPDGSPDVVQPSDPDVNPDGSKKDFWEKLVSTDPRAADSLKAADVSANANLGRTYEPPPVGGTAADNANQVGRRKGFGDIKELDASRGLDTPAPAQSVPPDASPPQAASASPAPAEKPINIPSGGVLPGTMEAIDASAKGQSAAAQATAKIIGQEGQQDANFQQQYVDASNAVTKQMTTDAAANKARQDQLNQDIASSKVDPEKFWASRSTGQKIAGIAGLIVGGFYSGFTGRDNPAEKMISQAIDRDVEAQKSNISGKQNQLRMYMEQGHDIIEAAKLRKADLLENTAAQIKKVAMQTAGPKAQAAADASTSKMLGEAAELKNSAYAKSFSNKMESIKTKLAIAQQGREVEAGKKMSEVLSAISSGDHVVPPEVMSTLPQSIQEKAVTMADGKTALARTKEGADIVNKSQAAAAEMRRSLAEYNELLKSHPNGISSTTSPTDYARAGALHNSIITKINELNGMSRFTSEEKENYMGRVPDITSKQMPWSDGFQAQMQQLGDDVDNKVSSTDRTYLNVHRTAPQKLVTD